MFGPTYDLSMKVFDFAGLSKLRAILLSQAQGKVLEIGIGTGLNISYYPVNIELTGIEPNEGMRRRAEKRAKGKSARIISGDAERIEFPDSEFDTVVCTLALCSVEHPERVVNEVHRVLKPGGKFLLLEHVKGNVRGISRFFDLVDPAWKVISGGCHLNRDPSEHLQKVGFRTESLQTLWHGLGKLWVLRK